ncbi:hypothetical protein B7463_g4488, partial [Scytalidium lignicola]
MSWDTPAGGGDFAATFNDDHPVNGADNYGGGDTFGNGEQTGSYGEGMGTGDDGDAGNYGGGGNSGACFNCGELGHSKAECPAPPKPRACFNCGQEGHNKAECPNEAVPREFTGTCRLCEQEGHRAADCPTAPPRQCKNCEQEGHSILECKNPRKIDRSDIEDVEPEAAWEELKAAAAEGDIDDVKVAAAKYIKSTPTCTYVELEKAFRYSDIGIYLIALEKELAATYTNMDFQGNLDRKYTVSWRLSNKPKRPKERDGWPTPEENLERLDDAGEAVDRGMPKCGNCDALGHTAKFCKEEKVENSDRPAVKCYNCSEVGHRVRDCPVPREDKFACRNCKQSGHSAKECPEPRNAEGVECKKCGETGHFARDCPTGGDGGGGMSCFNCGGAGHRSKDCTEPKKLICRNCDGEGHTSKECPKPRDYSRVQCQNCKQMGHTKVRCKEPFVPDNDGPQDQDKGYADAGGNDYAANTDNAGTDDAFGASSAPATGYDEVPVSSGW